MEERFGGEEKDEVEGDDVEGDDEESDDEDGVDGDEELGRKRKRPKFPGVPKRWLRGNLRRLLWLVIQVP